MENARTDSNDRPLTEIIIARCGSLPVEKPFRVDLKPSPEWEKQVLDLFWTILGKVSWGGAQREIWIKAGSREEGGTASAWGGGEELNQEQDQIHIYETNE